MLQSVTVYVITVSQVCLATRSAPSPSPGSGALLMGRIVSAVAGCGDSSGVAVATLAADGLPLTFGDTPVSCRFLQWSLLQTLHAQAAVVSACLDTLGFTLHRR